ncbi:MAG: GFA family protein [Rhodobacteraceae bacterium]|nr:GFA family protein [Paracoccaceae bacterium]
MAEIVKGQCKCGAVQYSGTRHDAPMFRCYCRDCQQITGAGHSEMMPLVASSFEFDGPYRQFEMTGGSGRPTWSGFCSNCGSPLTRRSARMADRVYVHAASLSDPSAYQPSKVINSHSAQPWDRPTET